MKILLVFAFLSIITLSCSQIQCETCTEYQLKAFESIDNGNYCAYRKFMRKYKDPNFSCCEENRGFIRRLHLDLRDYVKSSHSLPIIKDYFKYELSQKVKDNFLTSYLEDDNEEILKFLIKKNGKILGDAAWINILNLDELKKLNKNGYDFGYIDPSTGNNLFLDFCKSEPRNSKERKNVIECLTYLHSLGIDIKLKNSEGKSALDLARDSLIRDYLKTL
jgi:hypothetical protein